MSEATRDLAAVQKALQPRWRRLGVGDLVTPRGGRRQGQVVEIVETDALTGVSTHVRVRWGRKQSGAQIWPTDFLVVEQRPELA